jgi:hypothetical protein
MALIKSLHDVQKSKSHLSDLFIGRGSKRQFWILWKILRGNSCQLSSKGQWRILQFAHRLVNPVQFAAWQLIRSCMQVLKN